MGNLCCRKKPASYDELVVSEGSSRLDVTVSADNQYPDAVDETDITPEVITPDSGERPLDSLSYISHPYICDEDVVQHLLLQKTMFIMRGVPGSGKSTLVRELLKRFPKAVVCSADLFWMTPDGDYVFDAKRLKEAHEWCRNTAYQACETGKGHIIIDNTNVKRWEFKYYSDIAARFNYLTIFVEPQTPWRFNAEILFTKGTHNVPMHALQAKIQGFEETPVAVFYGWFPNQITLETVMRHAKSCIAIVSHGELRFQAGFPEDVDVGEWFHLKSEIHVTSMFCDRGRAEGAREYVQHVQSQIGRIFTFRAVGVLITRRVVAAVVDFVSDDARALWNNGDVEDLSPAAKLHITLGTAAGVSPKQSGDDLIEFRRAMRDGKTRLWNSDDPSLDVHVADDPSVGFLFQLRRGVEFGAIFNGRY